MLSGHKVDPFWFGPHQHLIQSVELTLFGVVGQITGMNNEVRLTLQGVDLADACLKRSCGVWIGRFVEADVAVADLNEMKFAHGYFSVLAKRPRVQDAATNCPNDACTS